MSKQHQTTPFGPWIVLQCPGVLTNDYIILRIKIWLTYDCHKEIIYWAGPEVLHVLLNLIVSPCFSFFAKFWVVPVAPSAEVKLHLRLSRQRPSSRSHTCHGLEGLIQIYQSSALRTSSSVSRSSSNTHTHIYIYDLRPMFLFFPNGFDLHIGYRILSFCHQTWSTLIIETVPKSYTNLPYRPYPLGEIMGT